MKKFRLRRTEEWFDYFQANAQRLLELPWDAGPALRPEELAEIAESVREFQLGESSDGRRSMAIARNYAERYGDPLYADTMAAFFDEEHRHARDLGRFLTLAGVPLMQHSWGDAIFRVARRALNLELLLVMLLTVELIAKVYYRALRDATGSPLLRRLCTQILRDEAAHVRFHLERLARIRRYRPRWLIALVHLGQRFLYSVTCLVVWRNHRRALRAGGYDFRRYWWACREQMNTASPQMDPANYDFTPATICVMVS